MKNKKLWNLGEDKEKKNQKEVPGKEKNRKTNRKFNVKVGKYRMT